MSQTRIGLRNPVSELHWLSFSLLHVIVTASIGEFVSSFLADRTNGRAIATLLRLSSSSSSVYLSVTLCIVAKRCVLEQKLLLRAYRKSYMRNRLVPK